MDKERLYQLLEEVKTGQTGIDEAFQYLKVLPYEDLGFARLDHHRALRDNFPEVIFCQGKTDEQIRTIFTRLAANDANVIATRASYNTYLCIKPVVAEVEYDEIARIIYRKKVDHVVRGSVAIVSAGTSDMPVAEEAAVTLEIMGASVNRIYDVGVAGVHRLLDKIQEINEAQVVIAIAGMEGALASVLGGLTSRPIIAVPTSVGYGASFNGLAALLAMLNSCATGVGVVNIDNGFGAAALALAILKTVEK